MKKTVALIILLLVGISTGVFLSWYGFRHTSNGNGNQGQTGTLPNPDQDSAAKPPQDQAKDNLPESAFAIRGVIEGFYGTPWTNSDRLSMLDFMSQNHFNTYIYAPKDDPFQRARWGDLYPAVQLAEMKSLTQAAENDGISFVYSVSPGIPAPLPDQKTTPDMEKNSITFSSPTDRKKLEEKIEQLRSIGVHTIMLSFDDVQPYLKEADRKHYGSNNYALAHVDLANTLLQEEKQKDPHFQLWFAPTVYYGGKDNEYWQAIRSKLDASIPVVWTGSWVLNKEITSTQALQAEKLLGRKPLIWDNYPVNDYTYVVKKSPALLMGPLENRSPDLSDYAAGYMANPMIQPEASKVALATVGQYLYDPPLYQPETAWEQALANLKGIRDPAALREFCAYSSASTLRNTGNPAFLNLTAAYWKATDTAARKTAENSLRQELQTVANLPDRLTQTVNNPTLLTEINPWLTKLGQAGQAGLAALDYLNLPSNDLRRSQKRQNVESQLQQLRNNPLNIGSELIQFCENALKK